MRLFRFATLAHYDFAGAEATARLMQAAGHPQPSTAGSTQLLFSFCKENGIRVIAMVNLPTSTTRSRRGCWRLPAIPRRARVTPLAS